MMDDVTLQRILEADIAELEGHGDSDIARKVREDAAVRSVARSILGGMREADAAISGMAAARSASTAVSAGEQARASDEPAATTRAPHRTSPAAFQRPARFRQYRTVPRRTGSALAMLGVAAVAITLVVLVDPEPAFAPVETSTASRPMTASLSVASSRPFAVFPTDNPDIAIVWLFDEEER